MKFEYNKSQINKEKHGISFVMHKIYCKIKMHSLFQLILLIMEIQYALNVILKAKHYAAIFALQDEIYRIISMRRCGKITDEEFDAKFDNGEDIDEYLDFSTATKLKDINKKTGTTRQSITKVCIAERLKNEAAHL